MDRRKGDKSMKQGSKREVLDELMDKNIFRNALDKNKLVKYVNEELSIKN